MSTHPISVSALIDQWETIGQFASAIGCGYEAARQMANRGRIAPEHWSRVIAASSNLGLQGVSYEWLADQWANPTPKSPAQPEQVAS